MTIMNVVMMNAKISVFLVLFLMHMPLHARFYTLDQIVDEAVKNSPELQLAKKEIEHTEITIQKVLSSFYPRIGFSLQAMHLFEQDIPYLLVDQSVSNLTSANSSSGGKSFVSSNIRTASVFDNQNSIDLFPVLPADQMVSSIVIEEMLFNQGTGLFEVKIGRAMQHVTVCRYEELKKKIIAQTKKKYFRLLLEQFRYECSKEAVVYHTEKHRLMISGYKMGYYSDDDTLASELELDQSLLNNSEVENEKLQAAETLIAQSGVAESPSRLWLDDQMPEPVFFISLEEAIAQLHEQNSALRQLKGMENVHRYKLNTMKMHFLPKVGIGASYSHNFPFDFGGTSEDALSGNFSSVYAHLTWRLFAGLGTKRDIDLARNELEIFQLQEIHTSDSLELAVRVRYRDLTVLLEKLNFQKKKVNFAQHLLDKAQDNLRSGLVAQNNVTKQVYNLKNEKLGYIELLYRFHCSLIDFRFLIGSPP